MSDQHSSKRQMWNEIEGAWAVTVYGACGSEKEYHIERTEAGEEDVSIRVGNWVLCAAGCGHCRGRASGRSLCQCVPWGRIGGADVRIQSFLASLLPADRCEFWTSRLSRKPKSHWCLLFRAEGLDCLHCCAVWSSTWRWKWSHLRNAAGLSKTRGRRRIWNYGPHILCYF